MPLDSPSSKNIEILGWYYGGGSAQSDQGNYEASLAAYYGRGQVYRMQGRTAEAIADFEYFLKHSNDAYRRSQAEQQLQELRGKPNP